MRVNAIRLTNFRGFHDPTGIELKPLTVLLGPNSAGKSAFGHALAGMAHCQWHHSGSAQATLTPKTQREADDWPVDLGTFADLRTSGHSGQVHIALLTSEGWTDFGFGLDTLQDLRLSYIESPTGPLTSAPNIASGAGHLPESGVSSGVGESTAIPREPSPTSETVLTRINEVQWRYGSEDISLQLDGLIPLVAAHGSGTSIPLGRESNIAIKGWLGHLTYLRASRKRPSRAYANQVGDRQRIGYAGEWTAAVLRESGADSVALVIPPPISTTVTDAAKELDKAWENRQSPLLAAVGWWLEHFGLAHQLASVPSRTDPRSLQVRVTLPNQVDHDITEVGFGISQVLPVLTAGLTQAFDGLFIVDLPESHLHPSSQARMADFFCSLALSGRSTLVETHSEMFFHRLRLRVEMYPQLKNLVQVYFVDEPAQGVCSKPRSVGLTYDEELSWPSGFFQEGWETETQINIVRQARRNSSDA
jgi:predicted ATPase